MPDLHEAFARIDEVVLRQMERDAIPGLSLAITDREGLRYEKTYGYASLESRTPVRPEHLFEFGSIGKSFTCILLLQLAEEGLISLHEPVASYLPWFSVQSEHEPITLHHLMTHTAGIINGTDFPADARYEVWALRDTKAVNPPGERFHYSNVGYKALGLVLERVTGQSYAELVRSRILDPLGMTDTDPAIIHASRTRLANGYQHFYDDRPWRRSHGHAPATWLETDSADGCIAGTARDLTTYLRMLMNGGSTADGRILSAESFAAMTTPYIDDEDGDPYGYGLHLLTEDGRSFLSHGGGMVGYYAHMIADRSTGYGIVTLINGPGRQGPIVSYALDAIHAALNGQSVPDIDEQESTATDWSEYAGTYVSPQGSIEVTSDADGLHMTVEDATVSLEPCWDDAFLVDNEDYCLFPLQFERDEDGTVTSAHHGERSWRAQGQSSRHGESPEDINAYRGHYRSHNPWQPNFRIIVRDGAIRLVWPDGREESLTPQGYSLFRVGDEHSPEFIRFDTIVDGEVWRAHLSGCDYYRFFTP